LTIAARPTSRVALAALLAILAGPAMAQNAPPSPTVVNRPRRIAILSYPRGALIVMNGRDTLAPAPLAFTLRRAGQGRFAAPVMFEALAIDSAQCDQVRMFDGDEATPDTLRFTMRECPPLTASADTVYASCDVTARPIRVASPPARYPENLRQAGIQGRAAIDVVIDTAGRTEPGSLQVLDASRPEFGTAALDVVRGSRFWPARVFGRRVRVRVQIPINFTIDRR
jgi:TonB family protein